MPTYNIWRGDAQALAQIEDWVIENARVGKTFTVTIGNKVASYTLTQDDMDAAEGQSASSVAMRGIYAAFVAMQSTVAEFNELTLALTETEGEGSEVTGIVATGPSTDGKPFTATLAPTIGVDMSVRVIQNGSAGQNEIQVVSIGAPTGGDFTLTFDGEETVALAYNAAAATVQTELRALSNIGATDVAVTGSNGGPWTVTFQNGLGSTNVPTLSINADGLDGSRFSHNRIEYINWLNDSATPKRITLTGDNSVTTGTFTISSDTWETDAIEWDATIEEIREAITTAMVGGSVDGVAALARSEDESTKGLAKLSDGTEVTLEIIGPIPGSDDGDWSIDSSGLTGGTYTLSEVKGVTAGATLPASTQVRLRVGPTGTWSDWFIPGWPPYIKTALESLPEVGVGNVTVTRVSNGTTGLATMQVEFVGDLANTDIPDLEEDVQFTEPTEFEGRYACFPQVAGQEAEVDPDVDITQSGNPAQNEQQEVSFDEDVASGTFTLDYSGQVTTDLDWDSTNYEIRDALCDLSNLLGTDEQHTLTSTASGGTFDLTFEGQTATLIAFNVSAANLKLALEGLSNVGVDDVAVSGGPLNTTPIVIRYKQALGRSNRTQVTVDNTNATGGTVVPSTNVAGVAADVSVTGSGPWIVEFVSALAQTNVVTLEADGADLVAENPASFDATTTQEPTGPNWANVDENWSLGHSLADDEIGVLENSSVSILYGLNMSAVTPERVIKKASFTGNVGLPKWNGSYFDYRDTEWALGTNGDGSNDILYIDIGEGDGQGMSLCRINTGTKKTVLTLYNANSSSDGVVPAVCWRGTHADNIVRARRGSLGIGFFEGQAATVDELEITYKDTVDTDAVVTLGDLVTLGRVTKTGGFMDAQCGMDSLSNIAGEALLTGSGDVGEISVEGGTVYSQTSGKLGVYGAITGITQANPAVVSSTAHGLLTGDVIRIGGVEGMTQVNQLEFTIVKVNDNSFQLLGINSTGYDAWSAGGYWGKVGSVAVYGSGTLDFEKSLIERQVAVAIDCYGDDAIIRDSANKVTTLTYLTGQLAIQFRDTSRFGPLGGRSKLWVRQ